MTRKLVVGFDFDGVVAYNPFRVVRAPIKWVKKTFMNKRGVSFFVPKAGWQRVIWGVIHESSVMPAEGVGRLKQLVSGGRIEAHLITGRFGFLEKSLRRWLAKNDLEQYFKSINVNTQAQQPHEFKLAMIEKLKLDAYIEDNLDVVEYVRGRTKTRILWIYNLLDMRHRYADKFPYLGKALEALEK